MTLEKKYELACLARNNSYSPYSKFAVGAVVIFNDDEYVLGCNIENASYGLAICAERTALFSSIAKGYDLKKARELVIIGDTDKPISPCGACRQVISELLRPDATITLLNLKKDVKEFKVKDLLPYSFSEDDLNGK